MTSKVLYRVSLVNKDNSEKIFWTGSDFSQEVGKSWTGEQKQADETAPVAREAAEKKWGCPCPYDIIVEDTEGKDWYMPGGGKLDA